MMDLLASIGVWFHGEETKNSPREKKRKGWTDRKFKEESRISDIIEYDKLTSEEQSQVNELIYMINENERKNMDEYRLDNNLLTYKEMINKEKGVPVDSVIKYSKEEISHLTKLLYSIADYRPNSGHYMQGVTKEKILENDLKNYLGYFNYEESDDLAIERMEIMHDARVEKGLIPFKDLISKEMIEGLSPETRALLLRANKKIEDKAYSLSGSNFN